MNKNTKLFKNLTLTQKNIQYFKSIGAVETDSNSRKYRTFVIKNMFVFFGKSGSIRFGKTAASTKSRSYTDKYKLIVSLWASKQDQTKKIKL